MRHRSSILRAHFPMKPSGHILVLAGLTAAWGCSRGPSRLEPPSIPSGAGAAAVAQYDHDGDGQIAGEELKGTPAIKRSMRRLDVNDDGKVTAEEIDARIRHWHESKVGLKQMNVTVRRLGQPLAEANVRLIPEEFLGPAVKAAQGKTNSHGMAQLTISDNPIESGVQPGFFRIEISKLVDSKETIPTRYNAESELGVEVADDNSAIETFTLELRE